MTTQLPTDPESFSSAWQRYRDKVATKVDQALVQPHQTSDVSIAFCLHANGSVSQIRLLRSSGNNAADAAAIKAVESAVPFKSPPRGSDYPMDCVYHFGSGQKWSQSWGRDVESPDRLNLLEGYHGPSRGQRYAGRGRSYAMVKKPSANSFKGANKLFGSGSTEALERRSLLTDLCEDARTVSPDGARPRLYRILALDGSCNQAREQLNDIITGMGLDPQRAQDRIALARKEREAGKLAMAIGEYKEALRLEWNPDLLSELTKCEEMGTSSKRVEYWEDFLRTNGDSVQGHLGLAENLEKLGQFDQAAKEYQVALKIDRHCSDAKDGYRRTMRKQQ